MSRFPSSLRRVLARSWSHRFSQWARYAQVLVGNAADADDLVQEALMRTLRAAPEIEGDSHAHAYVRTAIRNRSRDVYLQRTRTVVQPAEEFDSLLEPASSALQTLLDRQAEREERNLIKRMRVCLSTLGREQRQIITMRWFQEPRATYEQIAKRQGITAAGVKYREEAALSLLREALRADLAGGDDG